MGLMVEPWDGRSKTANCASLENTGLGYGPINEVNLVWIVLTSGKERKRRKCGSFSSLSRRSRWPKRPNPKDGKMASPRSVNALDRA